MYKLPCYYVPIKTNYAPGNKERVEKKYYSTIRVFPNWKSCSRP